jgi:hypothetical protein
VEAILCAMEYDLAEGLQVILAQRLVLHRRALDPGMAAIILQPGYYDTLWYAGAARSRPDRLDALASVMMEIWSGDTPMALVLAPFLGEEKPQVLWFRLRNLTSLSAAVSPSHSIFVPPAIRSETDRSFERRISSWEELTTHLETELTGITEWFASPDLDPSMQNDAGELERRWKERPRHPFPEVRKVP